MYPSDVDYEPASGVSMHYGPITFGQMYPDLKYFGGRGLPLIRHSVNTRQSSNNVTLGQRRRRCANIVMALSECLVFAGSYQQYPSRVPKQQVSARTAVTLLKEYNTSLLMLFAVILLASKCWVQQGCNYIIVYY